MVALKLLINALLVSRATAYTTFSSNCTTPPDVVNFVSGPPIRGTMSILWTCLSVLILCVWNVLHLSVPSHHDVKEPGTWGTVKEQLQQAAKKTKWMLLVCFMPEFLFAKSVSENCASYHSVRNFADKKKASDRRDGGEKGGAPKDKGFPWTATHAYFANMRGFVLRFEVQTVPTDLRPVPGTDEGRAVTRLSNREDAPYEEQTVAQAMKKEAEQWKEYCKSNHDIDSAVIMSVKGSAGLTMPSVSPLLPGRTVVAEKPVLQQQPSIAASEGPELTISTRSLGTSDNNDMKITAVDPNGSANPAGPQPTMKTVTSTPPPPTTTPLLSHPPPPPPPSSSASSSSDLDDLTTRNHYPIWRGSWALTSSQLQHAYELGVIGEGTRWCRLEEIKDRSKGDGLSKGITVMQISWLVVQIVARAFQGLAITLLEVTVAAFATTAIATYFVVWDKPQAVREPVFVDADRPLTRRDVVQLAARAPKSSLIVEEFWLYGVNVRAMGEAIWPWSPGIPLPVPHWLHRVLTGKTTTTMTGTTTTTMGKVDQEQKKEKKNNNVEPLPPPPLYISPVLVGLGVGGSIFGAVHCAAWNFEFPTPVEGLLWRISSLTLVLFPLVGAFVYWLRQHSAEEHGSNDLDWSNRVLKAVSPMLVLVYVLARLYVIVETFRGLVYPQPSTFDEVDWAAFIPHLG